ncbi:hypothetical protein [Nocardia sp. CA-135398]|uniref:hypothetical protein n=1 Tax=Nocardia sp. CA-135398 TaxID=3239977 RepID=UPI003D98EC0B
MGMATRAMDRGAVPEFGEWVSKAEPTASDDFDAACAQAHMARAQQIETTAS